MKRVRRQRANGQGYDVGYRKPPRHTRFAPGQSGNPKGRPKGVRNFKSDVKATLKSPVRVTRDGKARKVSTQAAILLRLVTKALGGDARALADAIALARFYDDDGVAIASTLSADDQALIEIFKARVVAGLVDPPKHKDEEQ